LRKLRQRLRHAGQVAAKARRTLEVRRGAHG
jgi:hypothetical protein